MTAVVAQKLTPVPAWVTSIEQEVETSLKTFLPFFERVGNVRNLVLITRLASHHEKPSCPHEYQERRIISELQFKSPLEFSKLQQLISERLKAHVIEPTAQLLENPLMCKMQFIIACSSPEETRWTSSMLGRCHSFHHCPEIVRADALKAFLEESKKIAADERA